MARDPGTTNLTDFAASIVRVAFLVRIAALSLVFLIPLSALGQISVVASILVIAVSSIIGFYRYDAVTRLVQRHPLVAAVDVVLAAGVVTLVGANSPLVIYTLSTALLVGVLMSPLPTTLLTFILVGSQILAARETVGTSADATLYVIAVPAACAVIVLLGSVARILHEQVLHERDAAAGLRAEAAAYEERARIARNLHDSVAKSLHGIGLAAAALPAWLDKDPKAGKERVEQIRRAAEQASAEARNLLSALRDDQPAGSLEDRLRQLAERFTERSGTPVRLELGGVADVDVAVTREIVLIAGEALENVARHASAQRVRLTVRANGADLDMEIADDGCGFNGEDRRGRHGHYGLDVMSERASSLGGAAVVESAPGAGTTVKVALPACRPVLRTAVAKEAR